MCLFFAKSQAHLDSYLNFSIEGLYQNFRDQSTLRKIRIFFLTIVYDIKYQFSVNVQQFAWATMKEHSNIKLNNVVPLKKIEKLSSSLGTIHGRLSYLRSLIGATRQYLKHEYDISSDSLFAWESGKSKPSISTLELLTYAYQREGVSVSIEWLQNGGEQIPTFKKHVNSNIDTDFSLSDISTDDQRALQEIKFFTSLYPDIVYMYVSDESMMPKYHYNSWVVGRKVEDINFCIGKDCIVKLKESDSLTLRSVRLNKIDNQKKEINLFSLNPISDTDPYIINAQVEFFAPVLWARNLY